VRQGHAVAEAGGDGAFALQQFGAELLAGAFRKYRRRQRAEQFRQGRSKIAAAQVKYARFGEISVETHGVAVSKKFM
jgi:hypothetical protein